MNSAAEIGTFWYLIIGALEDLCARLVGPTSTRLPGRFTMERLARDLVGERSILDASVGKRATREEKRKSLARVDAQVRFNIMTKGNVLRVHYVRTQTQTPTLFICQEPHWRILIFISRISAAHLSEDLFGWRLPRMEENHAI